MKLLISACDCKRQTKFARGYTPVIFVNQP